MRRFAIPIVFLIVAGLFCVWWYSPTQVLTRKTAALLSTLTLDAGEGKANRHLGAYSLNELLARQVDLETPTIDEANGRFEREELVAAFNWLCEQAKQTRFEMDTLRSVTISGDQAIVKLTLTGLVELPSYRPADGSYDVTFDWVKENDAWHLSKAVWNKNL